MHRPPPAENAMGNHNNVDILGHFMLKAWPIIGALSLFMIGGGWLSTTSTPSATLLPLVTILTWTPVIGVINLLGVILLGMSRETTYSGVASLIAAVIAFYSIGLTDWELADKWMAAMLGMPLVLWAVFRGGEWLKHTLNRKHS